MVAVSSGLAGLATHLARRYFEMAKEVVDVVVGFLALVVSLPLLLLCAILIKLTSRGPVLYRQTRVGKDGKPFTLYKLRTMPVSAEQDSGPVWARSRDPRVLPVCRWMRRSHLDELPQLLSVIKGDMSLVGPRPERPEILAELERHYPDVRKRLTVRPGITGLAQIRNGYDTSIEAFRHKLDADLEYIRTRSWRNELKIMMSTLAKLNDRRAW
jgi:lipopolysaccharide/colanic/teichoic acid biosynthesis glycosyltransferase